MSGLDSLDQFFEPLPRSGRKLSKRKIRGMSKKQMRKLLLKQAQRQRGMRQRGQRQNEQGLGLAAMLKSKEFKQRVQLIKEGSRLSAKAGKVAYAKGKITAIKLASRIKKARSKSIYD